VLNPEQQLVVDAIGTKKNIVVLAGPGSGKSRTLLASYARMTMNGIVPASVAIVTYTQAAAAELSKRIREQNLPDPGFVGTLHSLMLRYLRESGHLIGLKKVSVVDDRTASNALKESIRRVSWKGTFEAARKAVANAGESTKELMLFQDYHQKLAGDGLVTFDGILFWAGELLEKAQGAVPFSHLMVDEYQDVSDDDHILYSAMKLEGRFVTGDARQAIFGFRGGNPECLMSIATNEHWSCFYLSTNYRSTPTIIAAANSLAHMLPMKEEIVPVANPERLAGTFDSFDCANEGVQFEAIKDFIEEFGKGGAIICRYNWQISAISEYLRKNEIPHLVHGAAKKPPQWEAVQALVGFLSNPESEVMAGALVDAVYSAAMAEKMRKDALERGTSLASHVWPYELPEISTIKGVMESFCLAVPARTIVLEIYERLSFMDRSWASLSAAMSDPAALMPVITSSDAPLLCTIHASKGREFESACLPYWADELFPGNRKSGTDEEWRLAYVAITRAKQNLVICSTAESPRYLGGNPEPMNPSRFIKAILNQ
jgi:DNA helicase-2/ATP-dependent DNA helicase PcrA